jgi:hypothetical protein
MPYKKMHMKATRASLNVQTHPTTNRHVLQDLHYQMKHLCIQPFGQHTPQGNKLNQTTFLTGGHILAGFSLRLLVIPLVNENEQRKYLL